MMSLYSEYSKIIHFDELTDPTDSWQLIERIGQGTYGEVHIAQSKTTGELVAVKIIESIHEVIQEIEEEYQVLLYHGGHKNIPKFHGIYLKQDPQTNDQCWIAMQLCSGGSVVDIIKTQLANDKTVDELVIAFILRETMEALQHLHINCVIHRDVKGHNILLTSDAQIKLVDFGVSGHLHWTVDKRNTSVGTPFWMAPEVIACEQQLDYCYDLRCDTWSLGITAIELADGKPPLADQHPMKALFLIPRNPPPCMSQPEEWSEKFRDFIAKCLVKDFEERCKVEELLTHPFITQLPEDTTEIREQLLELIKDTGKVLHEPYVTMKDGHLRSKKKNKKSPLSVADDLAAMEDLEESSIVDHLKDRYDKDIIYTYIGDILLAVNPFKQLTIYTEEYSTMYKNTPKADNMPHIYAVADQSFNAMMHQKHNQCIVISGESGSGKTESANFLVQQLTHLGKANKRMLEQKILQVNPLVEAFGNAQTMINDNSSRFGKYLEMTFTLAGKVTGARLSEYLLEKSRVIHQAKGEQNFHIFYYLYHGLLAEEADKRYHLNADTHYKYLTHDSDAASDLNTQKFRDIQKCFEKIGFKSQEVSSIYSILSGIIHVGNIEFVEKEVDHQTQMDISTTDILTIAAELFGIDHNELKESLVSSGLVTRGETITRHLTASESVNVRDALSKATYGRLFSWIVNKINALLKPKEMTQADKYKSERYAIGILDIFGFENFKHNSFEQLCINIANEQIQYYFNQHIFAWEKQEYTNEGIDGNEISFVDNRPMLDMFLAKPVGMLALLDEESHFPKATSQTLVDKFNQNIKSEYLIQPKSQGLTFTVDHYAGKVDYDADGFLAKNRDWLAAEVVNVLRMSQIALVRTLFHSPITKTGNIAYTSVANSKKSSPYGSLTYSKKPNSNTSTTSQSRNNQTVASYFRFSLMDLLSKMVAGTPHFVRCLRPNDDNVAGQFDMEKVTVQLRYTGVLETTRIRRMGYSHRIAFSEFLKRYYILGFSFNEKVRVNKQSCEILLKRVKLKNWALGKSKVFLKYYHIEVLSRMYEEQHRYVVLAQASIRTWIQRRKYCKRRDEVLKSAIIIQKYYRGYQVRKIYRYQFKDRHKAAVEIQRMVRGHITRVRYVPKLERRHSAVLLIQSQIRGYVQRQRYLEDLRIAKVNAIVIQAAYRGFQGRHRVRLMKMADDERYNQAAITLQKYFRMWQVQAQLVREELYNLGYEKQSDDAIKTLDSGTNDDTITIPPPPENPPPSIPNLSEDRQKQMKRVHETKNIYTEQDTQYYDVINKENNDPIKQDKPKVWVPRSISPPIKSRKVLRTRQPSRSSSYVSRIIQQLEAINTTNYSSNRNHVVNFHRKMSGQEDEDLHEKLAEVDALFRSVLAASAANKLMANKPKIDESDPYDTQKPLPSSGLKKSESSHSMDWDSILENARQEALAPDHVPVNTLTVTSMTADFRSLSCATLDRSISPFSDITQENTQSIEMISRIEDDEVAYKEEFLEEQEEMKSHLVESLALQRTNSLSARFRRQRSQEIDAEKIKNEGSPTESAGKKSAKRALNRLNSSQALLSSLKKSSSVSSIGTPPLCENSEEPQNSDTAKLVPAKSDEPTSNTEATDTEATDTKATDTKGKEQKSKSRFKKLSLKMRQQSKEEEGVFNFKSKLKKTNVNPEEKKQTQPEEQKESSSFDFRSVLKKRKEPKDQKSKRIVADK